MDYASVSPLGSTKNSAHVVIEVPKRSRNKFELDKSTGLFRLDRHLYSSSHYPGDYGFIPQTLAEDGDPLDALVILDEPTFAGCLIEIRVIGMFRMLDRGAADHKLLGVPSSDPLYADYRSLPDAPSHYLKEIEHFFLTYKQLEGATVKSEGWVSETEAMEELTRSIERGRSR